MADDIGIQQEMLIEPTHKKLEIVDGHAVKDVEDYQNPELLYKSLIERVRKYHPSADVSMIEKAYHIARNAHKGQTRKSGEEYIIHPLWVGIILAQLEMDKETIVADIQLYIYEKCPHDELTIIMRRYMMRIAEHFAKEDGCLGLITGESIGQVASQTMQSLMATNDVCTLPVYRPLIGFDKQEIVDISEKIGTYETSILPYEDCCTIFVAKHPVTKPNVEVIRKSEENLSEKIDELFAEAVNTVETIIVK